MADETGILGAWHGLDLAAAASQARLVAFDLDNTLARSKKPMRADMAARLERLSLSLDVAIITGGSYSLVRSQVLDVLAPRTRRSAIHAMPTSGACYYRWEGGQWRCVYTMELPAGDRERAKAALERNARRQGIWGEQAWGERIEDRGSQVTFSALGQRAPVEAKERWDPNNEKKDRLALAVAAELPDLVVRSAGSTSVDVSARGVDKAHAVRHLCAELGCGVGQVVFVGDRMDPEGNDYPAAVMGTLPIRVDGPDETLEVCDRLIAGLA
ncbi:HAD-IIB family hydrolase [Bifidobacterium sp. ESL0763]|uniref:HAD-IIB family hydrolase n=1 Tax=Bifidobacterium sp. ESL0763 TaxID=2983227 RepID=UPI0023F7918F|nr:HAD-IIB family hydrolase [Bifidobacterium sp. ESL0763]MDF7663980.1 HAD-IIB family hydrolase [Bifidobacterium sp. ESL0763]